MSAMVLRVDFFLNDFLQGGLKNPAGAAGTRATPWKTPLRAKSPHVYHLMYNKDFWEEIMVRLTTLAAASIACACLISVAPAAPAAAEEPAATAIVSPEKLKWNPTPFPGVTVAVIAGNLTGSGMYAMMAKYAAGAKPVPHTHPDQRVVTVISGTYYSGSGTEFDESKLKPITAGTTIVIPANAPHYALAKDGETVLLEVGTAPSGTNIWPKAAAK